MPMRLSKDEDVLFSLLRKAEVLKNLHHQDGESNIVIIQCSDGHQGRSITNLIEKALNVCPKDGCLHQHALNGGLLLIPRESPIAHEGDREALLRHTCASLILKGLQTMVLCGHWPCAAGHNRMSFLEAIELTVRAKADFEQTMPLNMAVEYVLIFHIHHQDGRRRTYLLCQQAWEAYKAEHAIDFRF